MSNSMQKTIAFIGIRLLAIYFIVNVLLSTSLIIQIFAVSTGKEAASPGFVSLAFSTIVYAVIPIILWVISKPLANFMVKPLKGTATSKTPADLQSTLFCSAGLLVVMLALPRLVTSAFDLFTIKNIYVHSGSYLALVALALQTVFGLILMFKAKSLSAAFHKMRTAGLAK